MLLSASLLLLLFSGVQSASTTFSCGGKSLLTGLVVGGSYSARGEWPWLCAIYKKLEREYTCSGNLISKSHVVTVAHCMQPKVEPSQISPQISPEELEVLLGKQDLSKDEAGSERRDVTNIFVHKDWKFQEKKYDADVAILVLNEDVVFSQYIMPVCLPTYGVNVPLQNGTMVRMLRFWRHI
jgi:secreted trypsin-like serine protease